MGQWRPLQAHLDAAANVGDDLLEGGPQDLAALRLELLVLGRVPLEPVVQRVRLVAG